MEAWECRGESVTLRERNRAAGHQRGGSASTSGGAAHPPRDRMGACAVPRRDGRGRSRMHCRARSAHAATRSRRRPVLAGRARLRLRPRRRRATGRSPTGCRPASTATGTTTRRLHRLQRGRARRRAAHATRSPPRSGHQGPARNDRRARRLVDALVTSPPFVRAPAALAGRPDARARLRELARCTPAANQHLVVDTEVIDGLRYAWLARRELGLSDAQAARGRRPHPPHRAGLLLALAGDPAQPDQLVRARLRRRTRP